MAFLWVYINISEITTGIRVFCKSLESSDFLICPKPENIKVLGLVEIRESGQFEQKNCILGKDFLRVGESESSFVCGRWQVCDMKDQEGKDSTQVRV